MPTTLSTTTTISGIVRNNAASINSIPKIEINIQVGDKKRTYQFESFEIGGQEVSSSSTAPINSSNIVNSIGIKEPINTFSFQGYFKKPESVLLNIDGLNVNIVDSQDYVTVVQEVEVQASYWS